MCTIPVQDAAVLMHTLHIYTYTHMLVHKCHKEIHPSRITYTPGTGVTIEPHTSSSCAVLVHMYTYTYLSYTCTQSTPCLAPIFLPYKAKTVAQQQHSNILDGIHQYSPVFTSIHQYSQSPTDQFVLVNIMNISGWCVTTTILTG